MQTFYKHQKNIYHNGIMIVEENKLPSNCPYCGELVNYLNHKHHLYMYCEKDNKITTEKDKMQEFKEFAFELKTNRDYYSRARIIEDLVNKVEELFNKKQNI